MKQVAVIASAIFKFQSKPVSINNFYYGDKRHGIREEAKDWQYGILAELAKDINKQIIRSLKDKFNSSLHGYKVSIVYAAPSDTFFTKKGAVSSRQIDLSNCEKSLIDLLFIPKYNGVYGACNLDIDDKWIMELSSKKTISTDEHYWTMVRIEIIELPKLV